jgi:hypothetical protein
MPSLPPENPANAAPITSIIPRNRQQLSPEFRHFVLGSLLITQTGGRLRRAWFAAPQYRCSVRIQVIHKMSVRLQS